MRIHIIAGLIDKCNILADVGCDHGLVSEQALKAGKCDKLIASDISEKCLAKARKTLRDYPNVIYRVCDGVPDGDNPDFIVISGMGGHTIAGILSGYDGGAKLLLSPQSHAELVRGHLCGRGYKIVYDKCFEDKGKFYDIIKAEPGGAPYALDTLRLKYGAYEERSDALKRRLERILGKLPAGSEKRSEPEEVMKWQK